MSLWNPSPTTSQSDSEKQIYLGSDGVLTICMFNLKLTTTCDMHFKHYPFDGQVNVFI